MKKGGRKVQKVKEGRKEKEGRREEDGEREGGSEGAITYIQWTPTTSIIFTILLRHKTCTIYQCVYVLGQYKSAKSFRLMFSEYNIPQSERGASGWQVAPALEDL